MIGLIKKFFDRNEREVKKLWPRVKEINDKLDDKQRAEAVKELENIKTGKSAKKDDAKKDDAKKDGTRKDPVKPAGKETKPKTPK